MIRKTSSWEVSRKPPLTGVNPAGPPSDFEHSARDALHAPKVFLRKTLICLALAGATFGCTDEEQTITAEPTGDAVEDAKTAALAWLELVDDGDYEESWDEAAEYFRGAVPKDQWVNQVRGVRAPLGDLQSRALRRATPASSLPGAPDGEYVVIEYQTSYANKASSVETVTPMRDPDGTFRVSGYYIR